WICSRNTLLKNKYLGSQQRGQRKTASYRELNAGLHQGKELISTSVLTQGTIRTARIGEEDDPHTELIEKKKGFRAKDEYKSSLP
ncbi:unnamed protein product, partial [Gulo gulo]